MAQQQELSRRNLLRKGLLVALVAVVGGFLFLLLSGSERQAVAGSPVTLQNAKLLVSIDSTTGAITRICNKVKDLELIDPAYSQPSPAVPWKIETTPGSAESNWITPASVSAVFSYTQSAGQLNLTWSCDNDLTVNATITLNEEDTEATFGVSVTNNGTEQVSVVEYPVIRGIKRLAGAATGDYLMHPYATGFLFKNPYDLFPSGGGIPEAPYPEGFNGCPAQVMAYYGKGVGGFYMATHDATGWVKWLDFFKNTSDDYLEARFLHSASGIAPGNGLSLPYTVRIGILTEGNWYEAAERYRTWAEMQYFCQRGPLHSRSDRATWLLEDVGFATFGINCQYDRSVWLQFFHNVASRPVFHISGPTWPAYRYDYLGNYNGGQDTLFPVSFHSTYLNTIQTQGDYFAALSFTTIFSEQSGVDESDGVAAQQKIPGRPQDTPGQTNTLSRDSYDFDFTCPVPEFQARTSVYRDAKVVKDYGANAIYWDIGPNNIMLRCLATDHGHPAGGGDVLTNAYRNVMAQVRAACMQAANGTYVPLGCEMVTETFIPEMDFYQARAEASPASSFEAWSFWNWIKSGDCEKIPLFAYIYHEYGPIRLDGWGKLAAEQDDLYYWIASRVFAWGGIYQLNYEFSSLENIGVNRDDITQHFSSFAVDRYYDVKAEYQSFLQELAVARTGFANPYVAYGRMLRPLAFNDPQPPNVSLGWFHYNSPPDSQEYEASGTMAVSSVVHAAWRYKTEKCGFLYVNLQGSDQNVSVTIDPDAYGLSDTTGLHVYKVTTSGTTDLGAISEPTIYSVNLPSRKVLMLELRKP